MDGEVVQVIETVDVTPVVEAIKEFQAVALEQMQIMNAGIMVLGGLMLGCCVLVLLTVIFK